MKAYKAPFTVNDVRFVLFVVIFHGISTHCARLCVFCSSFCADAAGPDPRPVLIVSTCDDKIGHASRDILHWEIVLYHRM